MAYIPVPGRSPLEAVIYRIRRTSMSDWVKLGLTLAGFAIITWSMVQQHDYRIQKLEDGFETHLAKHEDQNAQIQKTLTQIQIELSRLSK
jgi:hypothetical protein